MHPLRRSRRSVRGQPIDEGGRVRRAPFIIAVVVAGLVAGRVRQQLEVRERRTHRRRPRRRRARRSRSTRRTSRYTLPAADPVGLGRRDARTTRARTATRSRSRSSARSRSPQFKTAAATTDLNAMQAPTRSSSAVRTTPIPASRSRATVHLEPGDVRRRVLHPRRQGREAARRARHDRPGERGEDGRVGRRRAEGRRRRRSR